MSDDYDLSRRKLLGAAGTIGAAAALGGASTMAFFSDEESYANNQLVAGDLDLKVGWEEHYSDWSPDEDDGLAGSVTMGNAQPVGLPTQNSTLISVANNTDAQTFLNNTETEQYPNATAGTFDDATGMNGCEVLPDGSDQSPVIIDLDDVKPGDFGEVTFAFSVCSNPGYLWLNGSLRSAAENGLTEPESKDDDEKSGVVELLDETRAALWYDDGDNLQEGSGGGGAETICAVLVLDSSGSMGGTDGDSVTRNQELIDGAKTLAADILTANPENQVAVVDFDSDAMTVLSLTADANDDGGTAGIVDSKEEVEVDAAIETIDASGGTSIDLGIDEGDAVLADCPESARRVQFVVTDAGDSGSEIGAAADEAVGSSGNTDEIFAIGTGGATESSLERFARPMDDEHTVLTETGESLEDVLGDIGGSITEGEEVFFEGTLREALNALSTDGGIPLDGDRSTAYDEVPGTGDDENRDAFAGDGEVHYLGFAWYLPVDHANEIQSDSVTFDLGFYTAQERHNDGSFRAGNTGDGGGSGGA